MNQEDMRPLVKTGAERLRLSALANGLAPQAAETVTRAFLASGRAQGGSEREMDSALSDLELTLTEMSRRGPPGADRAATFAEYLAWANRPGRNPTTAEAAAEAARKMRERGGLLSRHPDGTIALSAPARGHDAIHAATVSVSAAELGAIETAVAAEIMARAPGTGAARARRSARDAMDDHGLNMTWAGRKNEGALREDTLALLSHLPTERRSLEIYNLLVPATGAINDVMNVTPTVALLWLDTMTYAVRGSEDLREFTSARSPGDIVRSVMDMSALGRPAWRLLARTDPDAAARMLESCRPSHHANSDLPPVADLRTEQRRWRSKFYDLMELQARIGAISDQVMLMQIWSVNFRTDARGEYDLADPLTILPLVRAYAREGGLNRPATHNGPWQDRTYWNVLDWAEDYLQRRGRLPKMSWEQYLGMSARWHAALAARRATPQATGEDLAWKSALGEFERGDYRVVPLLSQKDLAEESARMGHCVGYGGYARRCAQNTSRIFHIEKVRGKGARRPMATAQITGGLSPDDWRLAQLQGPGNSADLPMPVRSLARSLPDRYKRALSEQRR